LSLRIYYDTKSNFARTLFAVFSQFFLLKETEILPMKRLEMSERYTIGFATINEFPLSRREEVRTEKNPFAPSNGLHVRHYHSQSIHPRSKLSFDSKSLWIVEHDGNYYSNFEGKYIIELSNIWILKRSSRSSVYIGCKLLAMATSICDTK
jgi:hypothetical protein